MSDSPDLDTDQSGGGSPIAVDLDGDLVPDLTTADLDGDGTSDMVITADEGGALTAYVEINGHPGWDLLIKDFDADGVADATMEDADGDGYPELVTLANGTQILFDPASNQIVDVAYPDGAPSPADPAPSFDPGVPQGTPIEAPTYDPATPTDQSPFPYQPGLPQSTTPVEQGTPAYDPEAPTDQSPFPYQPGLPQSTTPVDQGTPANDPSQNPIQAPVEQPQPIQPAPEIVDPGTAQTPGIFGYFEDDRWATQYQTTNGFCAPVSVAMVVSEFIGRFVSEDETVTAALDLGVLTYSEGGRFDGWSGLTMPAVEQLIEHFGIPAHQEPAAGEPNEPLDALHRLEGHLAANHGVILMVDGDEVWTRGLGDDATADDGPNHALVIRQIDEVHGTVILNDPGNKDGGNEYEMSIDDFMEAWDDSGFRSVVTDDAPGAASEEAAAPASAAAPLTSAVSSTPESVGVPAATVPAAQGAGGLVGARVGWTGLVILPVLLVGKALKDRITVVKRS